MNSHKREIRREEKGEGEGSATNERMNEFEFLILFFCYDYVIIL